MPMLYKEEFFLRESQIKLNYFEDTSEVPLHAHEFVEFAYILDGEAQHTCNDATLTLHKGDYIFIDYNTFHCFTDKSDNFKLINCLFVPKYIDISLNNCTSFTQILHNYLINASPLAKDSIYIFKDEDGSIERIIKEMLKEQTQRAGGYNEILRSYLLQIIILSMRKSPSLTSRDPRAEQMVEYVNKNYAREIRLGELGRLLNSTNSNLSMLFKKNVGMTFTEYVHYVRIKASCTLLTETDESIESIASRVGFSDTRHFRRIFKSLVGTTPIKHRLGKM